MNVLVSGMVAATPGQGGATWAVLQYVLGLRRLGHDVHLVEPVPTADSGRQAWCRQALEPYGLEGRWCLLGDDGSTAGLTPAQLRRVASGADVLLNISGMLTSPAVLERVPIRVYLDLDPGFVQLWSTVDGVDMRFDAHTHFVSISDSIGKTVPDCGRSWTSTLPPVVLEQWPPVHQPPTRGLTTVGHWRSYGSIDHGGVLYGQKAHTIRSFGELPRSVPVDVELALAIHEGDRRDREALQAAGWNLVDPADVVPTPVAYRDYIQQSLGEIGFAKSGYIAADTGWFSDRSVCYLASGRPVLASDTGFGRRLPTGSGLLAFADVDDARTAIHALLDSYDDHRRAARSLAEEHLDSDRVLAALLGAVS